MRRAAVVLAAILMAADLAAQSRGFVSGGHSTSTSRMVSPAVVASWMSHDSLADGSSTSLLVLWRGTPGWFSKGRPGQRSGGSSGGSEGSGARAYQYFTEGGLTFTLEFDHDKHTVTVLNETFSLKDVNVLLVDFVDSATGPAIVGWRFVEPGPPAPPAVPGAASDPIAGVIRRSQELQDYLRCDLTLPDPAMNAMTAMVCGLMRPAAPR